MAQTLKSAIYVTILAAFMKEKKQRRLGLSVNRRDEGGKSHDAARDVEATDGHRTTIREKDPEVSAACI